MPRQEKWTYEQELAYWSGLAKDHPSRTLASFSLGVSYGLELAKRKLPVENSK